MIGNGPAISFGLKSFLFSFLFSPFVCLISLPMPFTSRWNTDMGEVLLLPCWFEQNGSERVRESVCQRSMNPGVTRMVIGHRGDGYGEEWEGIGFRIGQRWVEQGESQLQLYIPTALQMTSSYKVNDPLFLQPIHLHLPFCSPRDCYRLFERTR